MHPAIQASIDYWREVAKLLPYGEPNHVSHYVVKENGQLKCYGVKWNGHNLDDHVLFAPPDAEELIKEAIEAMDGQEEIGSEFTDLKGKPMKVSCWVHASPGRNMDCWLSSFAESLIEGQMPAPITYATKWIEEGRVV